jgi:hypothetical protein
MSNKLKLEKFNNIINTSQYIASNKDTFLEYLHFHGRITNSERDLLREIRDKNIFPSNTIKRISRFFMVVNFMKNYQLEIIECFDLIDEYISDTENNKIVLENKIMDILGKTHRCISSLDNSIRLDQPNGIRIKLKENEEKLYEYLNTIFPSEIEIDIVEHIVDGARKVCLENKKIQTNQLMNFINRENIFDKIHLKFIIMTAVTFTNCLNDFYLKFSKNLPNLSKKDIEKLDLPDLITKVNAKNTDLSTLMVNFKSEYDKLMEYLQSDVDFKGNLKSVQIKKSFNSSFEWIALEENHHHIQKIHSIFVLCNYNKWFSCDWFQVSSVDRKKIIYNTFGIEISRQNLSNEKINKIEKDIKYLKKISIYHEDIKYLNFIKIFITNYS